MTNRDESDEMSHPQPTPQDDDQTPVKPWAIPFDELTEGQVITVEVRGIARRYRVKSVTHEGNTWTASVALAELDGFEVAYLPIEDPKTEPVFDVAALVEASAAAVQRRIMEDEVTTFSRTDHHTPQGWSHVAGTEPDERRAFLGPYTSLSGLDQAGFIESIAQWLGERESTHLWPEIHESDKACYRDAARDLITKTKFGLVASAVSLNPEERKIAADALEAMGPGAAAAAESGMKLANRHIQFAGQEAGKAFAAGLEAMDISVGLKSPKWLQDINECAKQAAVETINLSLPDDIVAVRLPEPLGDDGINVAWRKASFWHGNSETEKAISIHDTYRYMTIDAAESLAVDLLAAVAKARQLKIEAGE